MLRIPEIEEVLEIGKKLGFDFTRTEAEIVREQMAGSLQGLDTFYEARIEEERPPLRYLTRDPGYRPSDAEDPLNAFLRRCRIEGAAEGALKGKTVAFKDHTAVAGVPMTFASHFMEEYVPDFDATIATRLLDAGATITGKLNMDDFSNGGPNYAIWHYGRVNNPHDPDSVTGGSSSGSGAAVAAGYVDIAIGGDQGGSIRIPAAWCGIVGIKATFGLIPHTGVIGSDPSIDYVGPMTRTVEEAAAALEAIAGRDGYDPRQTFVPSKLPAYTQGLRDGVKGLRIGVLKEGMDRPGTEADVKEAVMAAVDMLEREGAIVSFVSVPEHASLASSAQAALSAEGSKYLFDTNFAGAFAKTWYPQSLITTIGRHKQSSAHELPLTMRMRVTLGQYVHQRYHGRLYAKAHNVRKTIVRAYDKAFEEVDLLVMPTVPTVAPKYRAPASEREAVQLALSAELSPTDPVMLRNKNTQPFNYTGHPAISVPCGKSGGLPIGLQLVGRSFEEATLLRAAYAVEAVAGYEHLPLPGKQAITV